ncbi:MAG: N-acetylmuramoyl-L-alanine amidase [Bifidobacteriaceae bacterium]|nr:N-acetylmuramoyl-L-alanine amidase [Bifidobacteriaceae bacterium]
MARVGALGAILVALGALMVAPGLTRDLSTQAFGPPTAADAAPAVHTTQPVALDPTTLGLNLPILAPAATPTTTRPAEPDRTTSGTAEPSPETEPEPLVIHEDFRTGLAHGPKPAEYQRYIMLHDTEGWEPPQEVIDIWEESGNLIAAHFIIGLDGAVWQAVPLDQIAHHAGHGDTGHDELFGVVRDDRDDRLGGPAGYPEWATAAGMNSWSVGIELVHVGGAGRDYPEAQLEALDRVIAYIDGYYGFESVIIDHKAWRTGNSDMSAEFASYLANYQDHRSYRPDH